MDVVVVDFVACARRQILRVGTWPIGRASCRQRQSDRERGERGRQDGAGKDGDMAAVDVKPKLRCQLEKQDVW